MNRRLSAMILGGLGIRPDQACALDIRSADIVGGGNGLGTGTLGVGIDPLTGGTTPPQFFQITQTGQHQQLPFLQRIVREWRIHS